MCHLRMSLKDESGCLGEVIGRLGGGLELFEQGQRLAAHRLLHHRQLMQPGTAEDRLEPNAVVQCDADRRPPDRAVSQ